MKIKALCPNCGKEFWLDQGELPHTPTGVPINSEDAHKILNEKECGKDAIENFDST